MYKAFKQVLTHCNWISLWILHLVNPELSSDFKHFNGKCGLCQMTYCMSQLAQPAPSTQQWCLTGTDINHNSLQGPFNYFQLKKTQTIRNICFLDCQAVYVWKLFQLFGMSLECSETFCSTSDLNRIFSQGDEARWRHSFKPCCMDLTSTSSPTIWITCPPRFIVIFDYNKPSSQILNFEKFRTYLDPLLQ